MITLRPYQEACVDKIMWSMQLSGNDLICLPTGAGKSIVIAEAANRIDKEVLILQPSKEILEQNLAKLRLYVPAQDIGVYSASMKSRKVRKYTFATIQSIYKKPYLFEHIGLMLIDEAHGVNQKNKDSMYARFCESIGHPKTIGFTATPYRNVIGYHGTQETGFIAQMTLKLMVRMKPQFWNRMLYNVNPGDLVDQGYLCPLKYVDRTIVTHEALPFNKTRSDFDLNVFEKKIKIEIPRVIRIVEYCRDHFNSVLVFCSSVAQAYQLSGMVPGSKAVSGDTKMAERDRIIEDFKTGRIKVVFNVGVLTTGFDHPGLDCICLVRPTKSLSLYYQMLGRGVRLAPGKEYCTVIDFTGTYDKLGPIESIRLAKEEQLEYKNPVWELRTSTGPWHNKPLYSYAIERKPNIMN